MDCDICKQLGKTECGYHRFKAQWLSRSPSKTTSVSTLTRSHSSILATQSNHQNIQAMPSKMTISPRNVSSNKVSITVRNPQLMPPNSSNPKLTLNNQTSIRKNPSQIQFPASNRRELTLNRQNIQIVSPYQGVYYPIYPIYQIIYEPQNTIKTPFDLYLP